jgi:hypothetical protein
MATRLLAGRARCAHATGDGHTESGPDFDGGVEMAAVSMSSRQLANDGVDPDAWAGESEAELLLAQADQMTSSEKSAGLMHAASINANREKSCICMLILLAAWVLVGVVVALVSSLKGAFPATPPNENLPHVPLAPLSVASWVRDGAREHIGRGGDVMVPVTDNASVWQTVGGALGAVLAVQSPTWAAPADALSGLLEGHLSAGQWVLYKYRQKELNLSGGGGDDFHLRVPELDNYAYLIDKELPGDASGCAGRGAQGRAIAVARVGSAPSLMEHQVSMSAPMYVCMYVCMSARMYVCMCMSARLYVIRIYVCVYVCTHVCMYVCVYVCTHVCMYACVYVCTHVCMYVCNIHVTS